MTRTHSTDPTGSTTDRAGDRPERALPASDAPTRSGSPQAGPAQPCPPRLITLRQPDALDPTLVGAKAAGLARLAANGFDVPPAVVLSTGLAELHQRGVLEQWLQTALSDATAAVGEPVAVRSSATWEDAATSAHAGVTVTELDVTGSAEVARAVCRCVEGTLAAQHDLATTGDVAVIIQRLVPARFAGVAFTADPLTGERDVVRIGATAGLGESLVQGEVTGSDITVRGSASDGLLIDGDTGDIPTDAVLELAETARRIEALAGCPQDIEWALDDDGLHILQARDITVLPVRPELPEGNNWQRDLAHYPEPVTPFGWSVMRLATDDIHSVFDELGLLVRGLEEMCAGGEAYGRVLPAFGNPDSAGKPPPAILLGLAARIIPELRRRNATARRALETGLCDSWLRQWHETERDEMIRLTSELDAIHLGGLDDAELAAHGQRCGELFRRGMTVHFRLAMALIQSLHPIHRLVRDELGWDDERIARMFAGHSPATREPEAALARIRSMVGETEGARDALEAEPHRPVDALRALDPALAGELEAWIRQHGWLIINYDAGLPTLAERPATVTKLILNGSHPVDFDEADDLAREARSAISAERRGEFDELLEHARAVYPVREDNTVILGFRTAALLRRWMLEAAGRLSARDDLVSVGDVAYLTYQEIGDALRGGAPTDLLERVRTRRGEEAWARANPGPTFIGEQAPAPDTSRLPTPLRTLNEPVLWFISHEYPEPADVPEDPSTLLAGVAASAGVAQGPVRLVHSHTEIDRLCEGDVLVCRVTNPAWAPVFPLASAVIADGGGAFSHAAISARENGLPAVLGTGTATTDLVDGQVVRVDGTRGLVFATGD